MTSNLEDILLLYLHNQSHQYHGKITYGELISMLGYTLRIAKLTLFCIPSILHLAHTTTTTTYRHSRMESCAVMSMRRTGGRCLHVIIFIYSTWLFSFINNTIKSTVFPSFFSFSLVAFAVLLYGVFQNGGSMFIAKMI
jgi:hypothetical protein